MMMLMMTKAADGDGDGKMMMRGWTIQRKRKVDIRMYRPTALCSPGTLDTEDTRIEVAAKKATVVKSKVLVGMVNAQGVV